MLVRAQHCLELVHLLSKRSGGLVGERLKVMDEMSLIGISTFVSQIRQVGVWLKHQAVADGFKADGSGKRLGGDAGCIGKLPLQLAHGQIAGIGQVRHPHLAFRLVEPFGCRLHLPRVKPGGQTLANQKRFKILDRLLILLGLNLGCHLGDYLVPRLIKFNVRRAIWLCERLEKGKHPPGEEADCDDFDHTTGLHKEWLALQANEANLRQLTRGCAAKLHRGAAKIQDEFDTGVRDHLLDARLCRVGSFQDPEALHTVLEHGMWDEFLILQHCNPSLSLQNETFLSSISCCNPEIAPFNGANVLLFSSSTCKLFDSIKPFPASTNRSMTSSSVWSCALLTAIQEASQVCATILSRTFSLVGCDTDHRADQIDGTCPRSLLSDSTNIVPGGPVTHLSNVGFSLILW